MQVAVLSRRVFNGAESQGQVAMGRVFFASDWAW